VGRWEFTSDGDHYTLKFCAEAGLPCYVFDREKDKDWREVK
jgi:hypothetical protein